MHIVRWVFGGESAGKVCARARVRVCVCCVVSKHKILYLVLFCSTVVLPVVPWFNTSPACMSTISTRIFTSTSHKSWTSLRLQPAGCPGVSRTRRSGRGIRYLAGYGLQARRACSVGSQCAAWRGYVTAESLLVHSDGSQRPGRLHLGAPLPLHHTSVAQ